MRWVKTPLSTIPAIQQENQPTPEEKTRQILTGPRGKILLAELLRIEEITRSQDDKWKKSFLEANLSHLSDPTDPPPVATDKSVPAGYNLFQDETRFKLIVDHIAAMIWICDLEGQCTFFNKTWLDFTGRTMPEEIGDGWAENVHPEDLNYCLETFHSALLGQRKFTIEYRLKRFDDSYRWISDVGVPHFSPEGGFVGYVGSCTDINERKQAEDALQNSNVGLQALFDHVQDAILLVNDATEFIDVNPAGYKLLGHNKTELSNLSLLDIIPDTHAEIFPQLWQDFMQSGSLNGEYTIVRKNGTETIVDYQAVAHILPGMHVAFIRDITARKTAENAFQVYVAQREALAAMSQTLTETHLNYEFVLNIAAQQVTQQLGDGGIITLLSDDEEKLKIVAFYHKNFQTKEFMQKLYAAPLKQSDMSPAWRVIKTGEPTFQPIIPRDQMHTVVSPQYRDYLEYSPINSLMIVPLRVQGMIIGTLGVLRDTVGLPYTSNDLSYLQELANRVALGIENARLFKEVNLAHEQLKDFARQVVTAQEEERKHLSRELHDEAGQSLTALKMILEGVMLDIPPEMDTLRSRIEKTIQLSDNTMQHIRMLSHGLRPPVLDAFGLNAVIEDYCDDFANRTHIVTHFSGVSIAELPSTIEINLYRIVQEALNNISKHAQAKNVEVKMTYEDDLLSLLIQDDGCGFDTHLVLGRKHKKKGIGLLGIEERLILLGGKFKVISEVGKGTQLMIQIQWKSQS